MKKALRLVLVMGLFGLSLGQVVPAQAENFGNEGCTPGFWKNHVDLWEEYDADDTLGSLGFVIPAALSDFSDVTLLEALAGGGGPGLEGAAKILFRAVAAAYLNAAHEGLGYPLRRHAASINGPSLDDQVSDALATLDRDTILDLASYLDGLNNLGADYCD